MLARSSSYGFLNSDARSLIVSLDSDTEDAWLLVPAPSVAFL
jgi:hypothetical protein